ncbi:DNA polymerase III subunit alpha [Pedobacter yulinensis]|uniref:DNA-directed DNA polymerase n=1 Tax=Pedobacter yulinensis TaxID=2126353 RepID=A0A2T3HKS2_9SPHI|nr:DNA polymerase III subunit alpha [Pedobacter yulinensis]PST83058.1 DNA polymerase III subunit alpha [Pedobacter yulinensis]
MFLNVHSQYSLRYGIMDIEDLVQEAKLHGIGAFALTDINNATGALRFIRRCAKLARGTAQTEKEDFEPAYQLKPITGIDFRADNNCRYVGIARSREGMRQLNSHLTDYQLRGEPFGSRAPVLSEVFIIYPFRQAPADLLAHEYVGIRADELNQLYGKLNAELKSKLVCWQPVTVRDKYDYRLHEYLRAIDCNTLLAKVDDTRKCRPDERFMTAEKLAASYASYPFICENTRRLVDNCDLSGYLEEPKAKNKKHFTGSAEDDRSLLRKLTYEAFPYRYAADDREARARVEKELAVIEKLEFVSYFLIVYDMIRFSTSRGFYHVGRGSGANSIVAYCLKITDVDPMDLDLYFERFLNEQRSSPPDFDIDYAWNEREEVQRYMFGKYGSEHVALLGTMSTFGDRAVIREIGKVLGLPKSEIDEFSDPARSGLHRENAMFQRIMRVYERLRKMPNQRSIHSGGIIISEEPLSYYTALDLPPKGLPTVQWDMYEAEEIGFEKFDVLSQRGIGHIREAVELVRENRQQTVDIHNFKSFKQDPLLNANLRNAQAIGCFYIESPAMRQLLGKLNCSDYLTLVAASSIIRPGVAGSGMMKTYIENYHNPEGVKYLHPVMETHLKETFGVMVYQEDVIKICHHFAGLDLSDSDVLRRAMSGKFRSEKEFAKLVQRFFDSARRLGRDESTITEVWRQVSSFAGFSFSKAHSASFAVESYQSLYLKTYFPKEFMVAVLNNYGGFYPRWVYVHELKKTGARVHLPCVNQSEIQVSITGNDVWLGFAGIQGLEKKVACSIVEQRTAGGKFRNLGDFLKRSQTGLEQALILARLGALRFTGRTKKELLWDIHDFLGHRPQMSKVPELFELAKKTFTLPELEHSELEDAYNELELLGYPLGVDMFSLLKTSYRGDVPAARLREKIGQTVKMVGNYVCEKPVRMRNNGKMWFGTFLDAAGDFFDTVHFPGASNGYPFRGRGCYLILGKVIADFGVPSVEVQQFAKLDIRLNPAAAG